MEIPKYPDPIYRPPPKPITLPISAVPRNLSDINPEINMDFEENSPYQEGVILEMYQRPDKSYFQEPQGLDSLINTGRLVQKFLQKQALISPYFKDLYLYIAQNRLPSTKTAICKVETVADRYILLDLLLFKMVTNPEKDTALLAIPEVCADKIIILYNSSLFAGHQCVIKNILDYWRQIFHTWFNTLFTFIY